MTRIAWLLLLVVALEAVLLAVVMSVLYRLSLFVDDVFWYRAPAQLQRLPILSLLRPTWLDRSGGFVVRQLKRWRSGWQRLIQRPAVSKSA